MPASSTPSDRPSGPRQSTAQKPRGTLQDALERDGISWEGSVLIVGFDSEVPAWLTVTADRFVLSRGESILLEAPRTWLVPAPLRVHDQQVRVSITPEGVMPGRDATERLLLDIQRGRGPAQQLVAILTGRSRRDQLNAEFPTWKSGVGAGPGLPPLPAFETTQDAPAARNGQATEDDTATPRPGRPENPFRAPEEAPVEPQSHAGRYVTGRAQGPAVPVREEIDEDDRAPAPVTDLDAERERRAGWGIWTGRIAMVLIVALVGSWFARDYLPAEVTDRLPAFVDGDSGDADVALDAEDANHTASNARTGDGTLGANNQPEVIMPTEAALGLGGTTSEVPDPDLETEPAEEPAAESQQTDDPAPESNDPPADEPAEAQDAGEAPADPVEEPARPNESEDAGNPAGVIFPPDGTGNADAPAGDAPASGDDPVDAPVGTGGQDGSADDDTATGDESAEEPVPATETPTPELPEAPAEEPTPTPTEQPAEDPTPTPTEDLTPTPTEGEDPEAAEEPVEDPTATEEPAEETPATPTNLQPTIAPIPGQSADDAPNDATDEQPETETALASQPASVTESEPPAQQFEQAGIRYSIEGASTGSSLEELPQINAVTYGEWIVLAVEGENWTGQEQIFDMREFALIADGEPIQVDVGNDWVASLLDLMPAYGNTDATLWAPGERHEFVLTFLAPIGAESLLLQAGEQQFDLRSALEQTPRLSAMRQGEDPEAVEAVVTEVIDGETIVVEQDGVEHTVRYIGIDAPAADACYGSEATDANRELVEGKTVRIERQATDTDARGNLVRDVWVEQEDGRFALVSHMLVEAGAVSADISEPNTRFASWIRAAEAAAMAEGRGQWGACDTGSAPDAAPGGTLTMLADPRRSA